MKTQSSKRQEYSALGVGRGGGPQRHPLPTARRTSRNSDHAQPIQQSLKLSSSLNFERILPPPSVVGSQALMGIIIPRSYSPRKRWNRDLQIASNQFIHRGGRPRYWCASCRMPNCGGHRKFDADCCETLRINPQFQKTAILGKDITKSFWSRFTPSVENEAWRSRPSDRRPSLPTLF